MSESNLKTGYIYKIFNSVSDKIYIGSTFNEVRKRINKHKENYNCWKNSKKTSYTTSYILYDKDYDNVKWGILEEVKTNSKKNLKDKEAYWIKKLKNVCVNKNIPNRTNKEYVRENKERYNDLAKKRRIKNLEHYRKRDRDYREKNKEKINEKVRERRLNNLKITRLKEKEYWDRNKDKKKEKDKIYREKNKQKLKEKAREKIKCEFCGFLGQKSKLKRHQRTIKCKSFQNI